MFFRQIGSLVFLLFISDLVRNFTNSDFVIYAKKKLTPWLTLLLPY